LSENKINLKIQLGGHAMEAVSSGVGNNSSVFAKQTTRCMSESESKMNKQKSFQL